MVSLCSEQLLELINKAPLICFQPVKSCCFVQIKKKQAKNGGFFLKLLSFVSHLVIRLLDGGLYTVLGSLTDHNYLNVRMNQKNYFCVEDKLYHRSSLPTKGIVHILEQYTSKLYVLQQRTDTNKRV